MKKFAFPLERLRRWRELEREKEEVKLQALFAELENLNQAQAALDREMHGAEEFARRATPDLDELKALDNYRRWADCERLRMAQRRAHTERRIEEQRRILTESERKVEVLDQLKAEQGEAWRKELDKEQEQLVAELVVARWGRGTPGS